MKLFNSEKEHFSKKNIFKHRKENLKIQIFGVSYYNRWPINRQTLKIKFHGHFFFEKVLLLGVKDFHGLCVFNHFQQNRYGR